MLRLASISLLQFKNYRQQRFEFTAPIIGICGRNGVGKTNLLDAIHYLSFTKSYFSRNDQQNVLHGSAGFRIEGHIDLNDASEKVVCILRENGKKEFSVNDAPYKKFSEHIGRYPSVVIAPDDVQLIIGGSEERRFFVDTLLSQLDATYLKHLINYTRILQQRNSFLKAYNDSFSRDLSVLDVLDEQLVKEGTPIHLKRREFLFSFLPIVKQLYNGICQRYEDINLFYDSELNEISLSELLKRNRQKDLLIQRTSGGIHRDDLVFELSASPFKSIASQGQRKSLLFALKLAEVDVLKNEKGFYPLLLLDDVFEKLDEERIMNLLQQVTASGDMQIFITDTNFNRLESHLQQLSHPFQLIPLP